LQSETQGQEEEIQERQCDGPRLIWGEALAFWQLIDLVLAVVSTLLLGKTIVLLSPTPIGRSNKGSQKGVVEGCCV
jgi:hypothetical protein